MIFPIVAYGDPVLKKKAKRIDPDHPGLDALISGMYDTMYNAQGVGLAAPQIGRPIRLFVVDAAPFAEGEEEDAEALKAFKKTFINAEILEESGDAWSFTEGCLSIPEIREDVQRQPQIHIRYQDEEFETHEETYSGLIARVVQHEYDHIEGRLFTDKLSPLKKQLLRGRLNSIAKGKIRPDYPMKFPQAK